jgi:hypothetical protein
MSAETELDKAINLVEENGFIVVERFSLAKNQYIRKLIGLLEDSEYRVDEATIERNENGKATGRIILGVFPYKVLEEKERKGGC